MDAVASHICNIERHIYFDPDGSHIYCCYICNFIKIQLYLNLFTHHLPFSIMSSPIDIEKSIQKEKIQGGISNFDKFWNILCDGFFYLLFGGLFIKGIYEFVIDKASFLGTISVFFSPIGIYAIYSGRSESNRLHLYTIKNREDARNAFFQYAQENNLTITGRSNRMIYAVKRESTFGWGQKWIVIFDGDTKMYLNCKTIGRNGIEMLLYTEKNFERIRDLMKRIE